MKSTSLYFASLMLVGSAVFAEETPQSLAGYGKTTWGMSPEQVVEAEAPRAEKLTKPENLGLVKINNIKIGIYTFNANFIFDEVSMSLNKVNLTLAEDKGAGANPFVFSSLERMLTEKYGQPTYKNDSVEASWKLEKTVISVKHLYVPHTFSKVLITYKPAAIAESESKNL